MPCVAPFHPNQLNYVNDREHDKNPRKYWFLVLDVGLFTAKVDADRRDPTPRKDGVHLFFERTRAEHKWNKQCRKRHTHNDEDIVPESSDGCSSSNSSDSSDSSDSSGRDNVVKPEGKQEDAQDIPLPLYLDDPLSIVAPVEHTPSLKHAVVRAQPHSPKPAKSRSVIQAATSAATASASAHAPVHTHRQSRSSAPPEGAAHAIANDAASANAAAALGKCADLPHPSVRARPHYRALRINPHTSARGSPIVLQPAATPTPDSRMPAAASVMTATTPAPTYRVLNTESVASSVSSMSVSSVSTTAAREAQLPFLDLHASVSTGGGAASPFGRGGFGRFLSSARKTGESSSKSTGSKRRADGSMATSGKGKERESSPTRLLYNNDTGTLYKDPVKAVRKMAVEESMRVVELEEVINYMSSGPQGKMMP
ncbi:hypothetical protein C8R44DRAFT_873530 [Mycena epipterygia]|nr:hypothetical protein C8R44DRAFT_873530 [Mycena epipterygia]